MKSIFLSIYILQWNWFNSLNKTALYYATEKESIEIVDILLNDDNLDVNTICILHFRYLNEILNRIFL